MKQQFERIWGSRRTCGGVHPSGIREKCKTAKMRGAGFEPTSPAGDEAQTL
jgi:hypothetical protein